MNAYNTSPVHEITITDNGVNRESRGPTGWGKSMAVQRFEHNISGREVRVGSVLFTEAQKLRDLAAALAEAAKWMDQPPTARKITEVL
jgi:hypothetical protein